MCTENANEGKIVSFAELKEILASKGINLTATGHMNVLGREYTGFIAKIRNNKKIIAEYADYGDGGPAQISWKDQNIEQVLEDTLKGYCVNWELIAGTPYSVADLFVEVVEEAEELKELHKMAKKTIYAEIQREDGSYAFICFKGAPHTTETVQRLKRAMSKQHLTLIRWVNKQFPDTCKGVSFE